MLVQWRTKVFARAEYRAPARVGRGGGLVFQTLAAHQPRMRQPFALSDGDRLQLQRWMRSRTESHRKVVRSRIILLAARGLPVSTIAAQAHVAPAIVRLWCRRSRKTESPRSRMMPVGAAAGPG
jgi:hypothetical protein